MTPPYPLPAARHRCPRSGSRDLHRRKAPCPRTGRRRHRSSAAHVLCHPSDFIEAPCAAEVIDSERYQADAWLHLALLDRQAVSSLKLLWDLDLESMAGRGRRSRRSPADIPGDGVMGDRQRCRVGAGCPGRRGTTPPRSGARCGWDLTGGLAPVDLPVDGIVVLEQEERAGETERIERAPCEG